MAVSRSPAPPVDTSGLAYDTDLLALASRRAPDPALQAELAGFVAPLGEHQPDAAGASDLEASS